jgi:membrane protease subunit HflK
MKRLAVIFGLLWLATGLYVVPANERAVVRRCGRLVREDDGRVALRPSGLHADLPWPLSRVDRVNVREVRTMTVGAPAGGDAVADILFGQGDRPADQYLTGDRNILDVQLAVQYRVSERDAADYLFRGEEPERRLRWLAESAAADEFARHGVDEVYPAGLSSLRERLTARVREAAERERLGLVVEEVTVRDVAPPLPVKASFLDVVNARADRERAVQSALADAQRRREEARAEARTLRNAALKQREELLAEARGSASRFEQLLGATTAAERPLTLQRLYWETLADVLENLRGQVYLDTGQPIDLSILPPR